MSKEVGKMNDHELVDLKNDIERELKRRADGPKVITYFVTSCMTETQHFTDLDCALRCLKQVTESIQEWVAEDVENRDYINRCKGASGVKFQVNEMTLDHFNAQVEAKYFDDIRYPLEAQ